jgi:hypothetical protein
MKSPTHLALTALLLSFSTAVFSQATTPASVADTPAATNAAPAMTAKPAMAEAPLNRATLKYSNKWRIRFENRAKSDGTLIFRMTEKNAEPIIVKVAIKNGTGEGNASDAVKSTLRKAFPKNFKVEGDDGDHVLVKHNFTEGRFSLELLSNDVKKMKVKLSKE